RLSRLSRPGRRVAPDAPVTAAEDQASLDSYVWARVSAPDGRSVQGWLRTGEGYAYTAAAAVTTVEAVLEREPLGATTVAAAFGPKIALSAGGELLASA
ncbi:hypothetical protein J5X84_44970, partial [Streptosporangiaceae bacterium NEAU-GS5]|nr:hypothetical protein [Streptosporangiaceae bacterium NEAU-GS5]